MGFIIAIVKKITAIIFTILTFSFLLSAQPGGSSAGGPGGHSSSGPGGGPGAHGGPAGPSAPSDPGGKAPPSGKGPLQPRSVQPSSTSSSSPAIINYRGERKVASDFPLEVLCTSLTKKNNDYNLAVHFNQPVAPEKITSESVFFNGKNMGSSVIIKFNRKSDSVTLSWSQALYSDDEINDISILLKNVQTFDGKFIEELKVK